MKSHNTLGFVAVMLFATYFTHADIDFESLGTDVRTVPTEVSWFPGKSYDNAIAHNSSTMYLEAGTTLDKDAQTHDSAVFIMNGGLVSDQVWAMDSSTFNINGGKVASESRAYNGTIHLNGGTTLKAWAEESGTFHMSGGTVGWDALARDNGTFILKGGELGVERQNGNGAINVQQQGDVYIEAVDFGTGFSPSQTITLGDLAADPQGSTWMNGTVLDLTFADGSKTALDFRARNGTMIPSLEWSGNLHLVQVPEPSAWATTLGICGFILAIITHRKRHPER